VGEGKLDRKRGIPVRVRLKNARLVLVPNTKGGEGTVSSKRGENVQKSGTPGVEGNSNGRGGPPLKGLPPGDIGTGAP